MALTTSGPSRPEAHTGLADELTPRQRAILDVIHEHGREHGYAPSVREICEAVGLRSPSSVHAQLDTLANRGFLRRSEQKARTIEIVAEPGSWQTEPTVPTTDVPLVGEIAAGAPILADEQVEAVYPLPHALVGDGTLFMLRVRGDSMVEAGVFAGDMVVVREQPDVEQGEMCAALVDGEATVKFFRRTGAGEVFLDPANAGYEPIPVQRDADARVMGKVVSVLRSLR